MITTDVVCLGVHILDVHAYPVTDIPEGQGGRRIDRITLSAAGAAAGTAIDLATLGATVATIGCVGADDPGDYLLAKLARHGIDTGGVQRSNDDQTSATVLPIRPNGDRPTFHVVGANAHYRVTSHDLERVAAARHLHLGGPDSMGPFLATEARRVLQAARDGGTRSTLDILGGRPSRIGETLRSLFPLVDWLIPNEEQLGDLYGVADPVEAARAALDDGVGGVVVSLGADGAIVVTGDGVEHRSARAVDVVDTTGCGDALSAGFIVGLLEGSAPADAVELGIATASIVAQGLGSDAGLTDRAAIDRARVTLPARPPRRRFGSTPGEDRGDFSSFEGAE